MYVPAGEFTMGSDHNLNEQPIRKVYLDAYWRAKNLITVGQFKAFCKAKTYPYGLYGDTKVDEMPYQFRIKSTPVYQIS